MIWNAVYERVYAERLEAVRRLNAALIPAGFALLDRMLPTEVIQLPVAEDAEAVLAS